MQTRVIFNGRNVIFIEIIGGVSRKNGWISVTFETQVDGVPSALLRPVQDSDEGCLQTYILVDVLGHCVFH